MRLARPLFAVTLIWTISLGVVSSAVFAQTTRNPSPPRYCEVSDQYGATVYEGGYGGLPSTDDYNEQYKDQYSAGCISPTPDVAPIVASQTSAAAGAFSGSGDEDPEAARSAGTQQDDAPAALGSAAIETGATASDQDASASTSGASDQGASTSTVSDQVASASASSGAEEGGIGSYTELPETGGFGPRAAAWVAALAVCGALLLHRGR